MCETVTTKPRERKQEATGATLFVVSSLSSVPAGQDRVQLEPSDNVRRGGSCWVKRGSVLPNYAYPVALSHSRTHAPRGRRGTLKPAAGLLLGRRALQDDTVTTFPCETSRGPWSMGTIPQPTARRYGITGLFSLRQVQQVDEGFADVQEANKHLVRFVKVVLCRRSPGNHEDVLCSCSFWPQPPSPMGIHLSVSP